MTVHRERPFYKDLVRYMSSGPVIAQVLEGEDAIAKHRDIMGATDPKKAAAGYHPRRPGQEHRAECGARLGCRRYRGARDRVLLQRDGDLPARLTRSSGDREDGHATRAANTAGEAASTCSACRAAELEAFCAEPGFEAFSRAPADELAVQARLATASRR